MPETRDGRKISKSEAEAEWLPVAHDLLIATARKYNAWITYGDLAQQVQEVTGITTKQLLRHWIGPFLDAVSNEAERQGEPHLAALCVRSDQSIGVGYPWTPADATELEREEIAAKDRLACYQRYASGLPACGGVPTLTPTIRARFDRVRRAEPTVRALCPICFMELPASGICDNNHG